jgi:hypothetical protein
VIKNLIVIVIVGLALWSCEDTGPLKEETSNNPDYHVAFLFEYEHCRVYRFHDKRHYHFFTNCSGTMSDLAQNKNSIYPDEIPTNHQPRR